jgi:hypothetical protein
VQKLHEAIDREVEMDQARMQQTSLEIVEAMKKKKSGGTRSHRSRMRHAVEKAGGNAAGGTTSQAGKSVLRSLGSQRGSQNSSILGDEHTTDHSCDSPENDVRANLGVT